MWGGAAGAGAACPAGRGISGLYPLAWELHPLHDLELLAPRHDDAGALVGASDHSTAKSLSGHGPGGLEFEIA